MIQIPLSAISSRAEFAAAVEAHRSAVEKHSLGKPGIMAPRAHPLIADLIIRQPQEGPVATRGPDRFVVADYEIVDDTPKEAPAPEALPFEIQLRYKMIELQNAALAAKAAVLSPARANLLAMDAGGAMAKPDEARTPAEHAIVVAYTAYLSRCADIDRAAALAAIDVEELTELTISGWNPPTF